MLSLFPQEPTGPSPATPPPPPSGLAPDSFAEAVPLSGEGIVVLLSAEQSASDASSIRKTIRTIVDLVPSARVEVLAPRQLRDAASDLADDARVDRVFVAGDDSTVAAVADAFVGTGKLLGLLPLIPNLLTAELAIAKGLEETVRSHLTSKAIALNVAQVNGRTFCHFVEVIPRPWWPARRFTIDIDGVTIHRTSAVLYVGLHEARLRSRGFPFQAGTGRAKLQIVLARETAGLARAALRIRSLLHRPSELECLQAERVVIHATESMIGIRLDGETIQTNSPLTLELVHDGLLVLPG